MKKLLIAGAVLVAAGVGYYVMKPGAPGSGASLLSAKSGPLDHVPADTAFVFANVEPMPKAVTQAWMEQFAQVSGIYAMQEYGAQLRGVFLALTAAWIVTPALAAYVRFHLRGDV